MEYYKICFNDMPVILFSHKHETPFFDYYFGDAEPFIEISYLDEGDLFNKHKNGEISHTKAGTLGVGWIKPERISSEGKFHRHYTVAIGGQSATEIISEERAVEIFKAISSIGKGHCFVILPQHITDPKTAKQGKQLIESIIYERNLPNINQLRVHTLLFRLFDLINTYTADNLLSMHKRNFSDEYYCRRAIEYIGRHSTEKIRLSEIAAELELSEGYLSRIFKAHTNFTLIEYINDIKINAVKEILSNRNATLSELCDIIGIDDEKYLCRLFKKHTGMTITTFRKASKDS